MRHKNAWKWVGSAALALLILGFFSTIHLTRVSSAGGNATYEKLKIFAAILNEIEEKYVEEQDPQKLIYGAINGMVRVLDPHSAFLTQEEYKELRIETKGEFGGIGIEITIRDGTLTVVSPIEDTPAYRAGLQAGDRIIKIDGQITKDMNLTDAVKLIRGPKGEEVVLTILREGEARLIDVPIIRDIIRIQSVKWKNIGEDIAYIRVLAFQDRTDSKLKQAVSETGIGTKPLKGLILDLRNNPGGLLDQAVRVTDAFLDTGIIVSTKGRMKNQDMTFHASPELSVPTDLPMIVLVNQGSASGSEIVAGALQDHQRAVILGTRTFGKGSVQTIIPLDDDSGLRLTTALYYTPGGRSIQAEGIVPDVESPATAAEPEMVQRPSEPRRFLRERDLLHHLDPKGTPVPAEPDMQPAPGPDEPAQEEPREVKDSDPQLERAIDLLRTWTIFKKLRAQAE